MVNQPLQLRGDQAGHGAVKRIADRLLASETELARAPLVRAARRIAIEEDPVNPAASAVAAVDSLLGLGPLEALLADDTISDILVNAPDEVWVERRGSLERCDVTFPDRAAIAAAAERSIAPLGLRLDHASPVVDARLPDGSRIYAALPPVSPDGPILAIRRFTNAVRSLAEMQRVGTLSKATAETLRSAVAARRNILVCGGTGTGKTTLLNVLSTEIPASQRVVTIEDAAELSLAGHVVRLEARPSNAEGAGAITMQQLVRYALRMRPDRIVVGEVRGPEALDMIQAMATGHTGSMSTVHARDAGEALWRLELLAAGGGSGFAPESVRALLMSSVDLIVVMERSGSARVVTQVVGVDPSGLESLA